MIAPPSSQKRLLIPRWRSLAATIDTKELAVPRPAPAPQPLDPQLLHRRDRWQRSPEVIEAAELLESALVHGRETEALAAARQLAAQNSGATALVREQAKAVLLRIGGRAPLPNHENNIAYWRARTRIYPYNALAWVELALTHINENHIESAKRAMAVALQLAPHDRHVLRSAARLYFHVHDPERAYALIKLNSATPHDPWLLAAELALAGSLNKPPAFLKSAIVMLDSGSFQPRQLTELAGAAASNYLTGLGPYRRSRKLFAQSLTDPNDNAVAQAEWASQTQTERFLEEKTLTRFTFAKEAQSMHAFGEGNYDAALTAARAWIAEEPFSSRAYLGAASAANHAEAYSDAIPLAISGLRFDPTSSRLRNSLAFSYGSIDRLNSAEQQLQLINDQNADQIQLSVADANRGLIAMRRGELDRGEQLYKKAIDAFRLANISPLQKSALAYLAREAARANHPKAAEFVADAKHSIANSKHHSALRIIAKAEEHLKQHLSRATTPPGI